jgi:hypothetical protein
MKQILIVSIMLLSVLANAQTNTYPASGNVGLGTLSPSNTLSVKGRLGIRLDANPSSASETLRVEGAIAGEENVMNVTNLADQDFAIRLSGAGASVKRTIIGPTVATRFSMGVGTGNEHLTIVNGGNVGIGTVTPSAKLHIQDVGTSANATSVTNGNLIIQANTGSRNTSMGAQLEFVIPANSDGSNLWGQGRIITVAGNTNTGTASGKMIFGTRRWYDKGVGTGNNWNYGDDIVIDDSGKVGIGISTPSSRLHVTDIGSSSNATATTNNGLIIQANTGGRNMTSGAQLEFVIPANSDGTNLWGQGRIITVAGNNTGGSATGKMIFGTRRWFDKGAGNAWNYGDDIVIDAAGNVGIGSFSPNQKLTVNGTVYAREVKVDLNVPGPDYVFEKDYNLPSLDSIKTYIDQHKHLPEVPSAKEMEANGVNVGEMNMLLLKKIEELTLYVIEQNKEIKYLRSDNEKQQKQIDRLKF